MTPVPAQARELEVGEVLGPYRLEALLGRGGMGLVYRAVREPEGNVVALKVLRRALAADATFKRRFAHEARASAKVSHPRLVAILAAGEIDDRQYIAMTYVPGPTLEERIRAEGRLAIGDVVGLASDLGAALDALHARAIVHRDVKPANVLFGDDGRALLTDFGLARGGGDTVLTEPGQVFGSLPYVAPELIRAEPATPATDLYALGCVVYEAATGAPPFAGAEPVQIGVGHLREAPPDPSTRGLDWPSALTEALLRALAKDPARRPASGADYARGLRAAPALAPTSKAGDPTHEVGGYRLVRKLGHGAGGSVWEGRHAGLGHRAALKLLDLSLASDDDARERFIRESRLVAAIEHPSIVPTYDAGADDGVLYIAMRYVDGGNLGELIGSAGPLPLARALAIVEQVAAALDTVHARGVVHRDVKPANILVEDRGERAFLSDFGIAYRPTSSRAPGMPRFAGTLGYAAPEQLDGKTARASADVYALGCVLFECLSGQRPFERDGDVAILYAHLLDPPPRIGAVRPELPLALDAVIACALAKLPDDRFASCGELVAAARDALGRADGSGGTGVDPAASAAPAGPPLVRKPLPLPPTPLVGRERELELLAQLLGAQGARFVTLTGPGGAGKSRLALEAARAIEDRFADGIVRVALDDVTDAALVPRKIADALAIEERATPDGDVLLRGLARRLERAELLLILDGFERVLPAAPRVAELLAAAPGLRVLVTSQAALRCSGEHELALAPLAPDAAARLFVDRARALNPGFAPAGDDADTVAEICRRLDGLPLALELAAARTKLLSPQAIVARLEDRLELLTAGTRDAPARHRTLRAAIDWTHELLDADEQALFARIAVFEGGCTPAGVDAVCGEPASAEPLDGLASLVDKSLVARRQSPSGDVRMEMLQTIREYARYRLIERGELGELRRRHAEHYLAVAEAAEVELGGADQSLVVKRLEDDTSNMRAALAWSLEAGRIDLGLRIAAALARFWSIRDQMTEGRAWLRQALARSGAAVPAPVRARALFAAAYCALAQSDYDEAAAGFERSLEIHRTLVDDRGEARCLAQIGWLLLARGRLEQATVLGGESLRLARAAGDEATAAVALADLAEVALRRGDGERALHLFGEVLALRRALGERRNLANALLGLGRAELVLGEVASAVRRIEDGRTLAREVGDTWGVSLAHVTLARIALDRDDIGLARTLATEALASCRARGDRRTAAECLSVIAALAWLHGPAADGPRLRAAAAALRAALGATPNPLESSLDERCSGAVAAPQPALDFEEAVELALRSARSQ